MLVTPHYTDKGIQTPPIGALLIIPAVSLLKMFYDAVTSS